MRQILITAFFFSFLLSSCIDQKSITYFNNIPDSSVINLNRLNIPQPLIQVNDLLSIRIGGESDKTIQYINQYIGNGSGGGASSGTLSGTQFQVSTDGSIDLPKIGKISVEGLTRDQAKDTITKAFKEYIIDPIIAVDFNSFKFTVIGEVKAAGLFTVNNQQINLFEALALAGDMTQYSDRSHVRLLRDSAGIRKIILLNFNDRSILNSPYYYLHRYDILYIQAKNLKNVNDNLVRTSTFIAFFTGLTAIFLVIFKK